MNIVDTVKEELLKRNEISNEDDGYDFYNDHIKYVVKNALYLAKEYGADQEIVVLGALLHDIALVSHIGPSEEHHIYGAKIAEELLVKYNYPKDRIERVKQCVLSHRGLKEFPRNTVEEECVADADVMDHFDSIPALFVWAFKTRNLDLNYGSKAVKEKLERDYNKLSFRTRELLRDRYDNIIDILFKKEM